MLSFTNQTIRWGIIGCGDVTEVKSGPAFYRLPGSELNAVMRRNGDKAADFARRHGAPHFFTQASALIQHPEVDAVYVATLPDTHAIYAIEALRAGKPVYVEKPMALNFAQCLQMMDVSEQTGVPLYVAYYRRALPYFKKVKEVLDQQEIGVPRYARLIFERPPLDVDYFPEKSWRLESAVSGGGYLVDMGSHHINLLIHLFGQVTHVSSLARNKGGLYDAEDFVTVVFEHASGVDVSAQWSFCAPRGHTRDEIEIIGTHGALRFSVFRMDRMEWTNADGTHVWSTEAENHVQMPMIARVNEALRSGLPMKDELHEAAQTTLLLDQILKI